MVETTAWTAGAVFADGAASDEDIPLWMLEYGQTAEAAGLEPHHQAWLAAQKFSPRS